MKHILFPTDFSDNSEKAFSYAIKMAQIFGGSITLFNSYKLPYSKSNLLVSITDRMRKDSLDGLENLKKRALEVDSSLNIQTESRVGSFVPLIPKIANNCNSNLIVMGTKGASSLKEIFIGSNTLEVIQITRCPVLAIPEDSELGEIKKIAIATDLKPIKHPEQLEPVFELAKRTNSSIEFVNVDRKADQAFSEEKAKQVSFLENLAEGIKTSVHFTTNEDIIDGLSDYINSNKPDLFAMLARKHSLFERIFTKSITNKLSFRTEIPLLVMDE